jgi:hypothetical protein
MKKTVRLGLRIEAETADALKEIAQTFGSGVDYTSGQRVSCKFAVKLSEVVRAALEEFVQRHSVR